MKSDVKFSVFCEPDSLTWKTFVDGIRRGDIVSINELNGRFFEGIRFLLARRSPDLQGIEAKVNACLDQAVTALQAGTVTSPKELVSFIRWTLRGITPEVAADESGKPEYSNGPGLTGTNRDRYTESIRAALAEASPLDREILYRFYVVAESPERICASLGITASRVTLVKDRVRTRCCEVRSENVGPEKKPAAAQRTMGLLRRRAS